MRFPGILWEMMTSDDISRMASQQMQLFEQSRAFTGSIAQASAPPMPSPDQIPAFSGAAAVGYGAAEAAVGAANAGVAGAGLLGMAAGFGFGGVLSRPLSLLDPFGGAFGAAKMGWAAGGGSAAAMGGSMVPAARALGFGGMALGGYMAAGSAFNAMTAQVLRGAQEQMSAQTMLGLNVNNRTMPLMGFDQGTIGGMSSALRGMSSPSMPFAAVNGVAEAGLQAGLYQNVASLGQFKTRTQELMNSTMALTATFGGQANPFQLMAQAQQSGFYGSAGMGAALGAGIAGNAAGIGGMAMLNAGSIGAQVAGSFAAPRSLGARSAMGLAGRISTGVRNGLLDSSRVQDLMGGASLEDGVATLSGELTQAAFSEASDPTTLMGLIDPDTGHIDTSLAAAFSGGMMSRAELKRRARRNRGDRGARMAVQARRGGLTSELMGMADPVELIAGMAQSDIMSRGIRAGESADDVMGLALQKFGNLGEQQAELVQELIRAGPSIKMDISSKMQEQVRASQAGKTTGFSLDALKKKLVERYVEPWATPLRNLGAEIASWGSGLMDDAVGAIVGRENPGMGPATRGGYEALSRGLARGNLSMGGYSSGVGSSYTGMRVLGQDVAFTHDAYNFGSPGLYDRMPDGTVMGAASLGMVGVGAGSELAIRGGLSLANAGWGAIRGAGAATSVMGAARGVAGGLARGVGGGALALVGTVGRAISSPLAMAGSALSSAADMNEWMGSYDNRGTVSREAALAMERLGMASTSKYAQPGYLPVETEALDAGFVGSLVNLGADLPGLVEETADAGVGMFDSAVNYVSRAIGGSGSRRSNAAKWNNDPTAAWYVNAEDVSRIPKMLQSRYNPGGYLSTVKRADGSTLREGELVALRKQYSENANMIEARGAVGGVDGALTAFGESAILDSFAMGDRGGVINALGGGDVLSDISDLASTLGGVAGAGPGTRVQDLMGMAGASSAEEADVIESELKAIIAGGGLDAKALEDYARDPSAKTRGALGDIRRRRGISAHSPFGKFMSGVMTNDKYAAPFLQGVSGILGDSIEAAKAEYRGTLGVQRENLSRFTTKGGQDYSRMAASIGSVGLNHLGGAAANDIEMSQSILDGGQYSPGAVTAQRRGVVGAFLDLPEEGRADALEMLTPAQQAASARGAAIYGSMTRKGGRRGENFLSGLMQLKGAENVMDQEFTTRVARAINSGKSIGDAELDDLNRLLTISGFGKNTEQARSALLKAAKGDKAGAREFAELSGSTEGVRFRGAGGQAKSGDMSQAIDAFNTAIKNAATVISNAAQGKNQSGPA